MAKVLKLHEQGVSSEDWFKSNPYGRGEIDQIEDPAGGKRQIVSVPSPFARMSVVDTALRFVTEKSKNHLSNLHGKSIHHQITSDFLDTAEAFFNFPNIKEHCKIIYWNTEDAISELIQSKDDGHKLLGETLDLFMKDTPEEFNKEKNPGLYFLIYKGKILGSTSPLSMFSSPQITEKEREDKSNKIKFDTYSLFDMEYIPLFEREMEFQKYFIGLFKIYPELKNKFKSVWDYIERNLEEHKSSRKTEIFEFLDKLDQTSFDKFFDDLDTGNLNQLIEIFGITLKKRKVDLNLIQEKSSFIIQSSVYKTKYPENPIPMALQNNYSLSGAIYTSGNWNPKTKVPLFDPNPIELRTLPDNLIKYPYITVNDFLESNILRIPYEMNSQKYFNGNINSRTENAYSYLLPIKQFYFDFFTTDDLRKNIIIEEGILESVNVRLKIPIRNGEILFEKTYKKPTTGRRLETEPEENHGQIKEIHFGLAIHPFVKLNEKDESNILIPYNIHLIDTEPKDTISLTFLNLSKKNMTLKPIKEVTKREKIKQLDSKIIRLEEAFDVVEVQINSGTKGILLPIFKSFIGGKKYSFSVDFGTTNTHIEVIEPNSKHPIPFEIKSEDLQYHTLHINNDHLTIPELKRIPIEDFFPDYIGKNQDSDCSFPQRTVLAERTSLAGEEEILHSPLDMHIPFLYEKIKINKEFYDLYTNLKWSNFEESSKNSLKNEFRIEKYLEELILLIQAKVLLNNGDLNETEIYWFYPSSMTIAKKNKLKKIWNKLFNKYISQDHKNLVLLSESIAPFYYYKNTNRVSASSQNVVSIDIGGGTTDVVIFKDNKPNLLTSFKFASNSLFGDGYGGSLNNNGFVIEFAGGIETILENNNVKDLRDIFYSIRDTNHSEDLVAFFFSLDDNKTLKEKNISIRFSEKLTNNREFKFIFFVYYTSIIYHIAKLMKAKNLEMPGNLTFSGMGSKAINLVSDDDSTIADLSKIIFEKIYNLKYENYSLNIIKAENPKEVTCKGGLYIREDKDDLQDLDHLKVIHLGTSEDILITENSMKYRDKTKDIEKSVISEINNFYDFLISIHSDGFNLERNLDINIKNMNLYFKALGKDQRDLTTYLRDGLNLKSKEQIQDNEDIEETFFFYPLVGAINNLAYHIATKFKKMR
jgi:hypothetical protein